MLPYLRRLARFEDPTRLDWIVYFVLFTLLHIPAVINFYHNNGENNAYLQFAQSLLHGQLYLPAGLPEYQDMIMYHDKPFLPIRRCLRYCCFPWWPFRGSSCEYRICCGCPKLSEPVSAAPAVQKAWRRAPLVSVACRRFLFGTGLLVWHSSRVIMCMPLRISHPVVSSCCC